MAIPAGPSTVRTLQIVQRNSNSGTNFNLEGIEVTEKDLEICETRLDEIEKKIRVSDLTDAQLQSLQSEEKDLKKEKKKCETTLSQLRKENGKNTFISFFILALIAIVYYTFWAS